MVMLKKEIKRETLFASGFLVTFFIAAALIIFKTDNSFGGGDPISHYKLARWAWKYPKLFLDTWGHPVFTILISPWAQFGMNGARFYNVFAGLFSAYFAWRICEHIGIRHYWLVPVFVLFIPIYFVLMFTSLTSVTFGLFLTLSIFFFFRNKFVVSGLILSFIPLVRTEGFVLFPLFMIAFLLKKRYTGFFSLFAGFIIFSFVGLFVYHDFFWLITRNPYNGSAASVYGHGELLHFVYNFPKILGYPVTFLFLVGIIVLIFRWIKDGKGKLNDSFYFLLLVPGSFLVYFAAHSYVWWKGIGNSLGLIRVIAAVTPAAAITAVVGFDKILFYVKKLSEALKLIVILGATIWIMIIGASTYSSSFKDSPGRLVMNKAVTFIKSNHLKRYPIYYFDPYFSFKLGANPYGGDVKQWFPKGDHPVAEIPNQSIIVWDGFYAPYEAHMSLDKLLKNSHLKILKKIEPDHPFKVLGGTDYNIYIFQKLPDAKKGKPNSGSNPNKK